LFKQADRDRLQSFGRGCHLGEDVNAVLIFLDHPLQAAHLAFDPAQPLQIVVLVLGVSGHAALQVPPLSPAQYPPMVCHRYMGKQHPNDDHVPGAPVQPGERLPAFRRTPAPELGSSTPTTATSSPRATSRTRSTSSSTPPVTAALTVIVRLR